MCVCLPAVDELVDGFGFMMITLSEGVRNQSSPNPKACLPSPQAVSKVAIDYSARSCLWGGADERDGLRNGEMIMQLPEGEDFAERALMLEVRGSWMPDKRMYYDNLGEQAGACRHETLDVFTIHDSTVQHYAKIF